MSQKRKLDREGLEVYMLNLLLAYRPLLFVIGVFLFLYAICITLSTPWAGLIAIISAAILITLSFSYGFSLYVAKIGAWLGSHWKLEK